jgi:(p)ppGpp synthase/HD superfamily hydrolase
MTSIPPPDDTPENRATFMARLRPLFPPSIVLDVELAYTLAKFGHRSQTRKELGPDGEPLRYFEHVRRVALILIDEARIPLREMVLAALLHDCVEDTRDITPALIEHSFGTNVTGIVLTLSKVPKEGYLERFTLSTDWRPYAIKACDRLDNLRSLAGSSRAFQRKQIDETRGKYYVVFDRMLTLAPEEYRTRLSWLRDEIRATTERAHARYEATETETAHG